MNITAYCEKTKRHHTYICKASIGRDYKVINADEYFYEFIGSNDEIAFTSIIYPADREDFVLAVEQMSQEPQDLIIRLKNLANTYRYFKLTLSYNDRLIDGEASYDVSIMDIESVEKHFTELQYNVKKYRKYMAMMSDFYFDYETETHIFKLFSYLNDKSNIIVKQKLDAFEEDMLAHYLPDKKAVNRFLTFCSYLRDGVDNFQVQFDSTLLSRAGRIDTLTFKSTAFYYNDKKNLIAGIMSSLQRKQIERAYYLTDAGKDAATGLFNKRATMEYVIDRIKASESQNIEIIIIDIDNFKNINDTFGHLFGDEVIAKVSDVINSVVGTRGVVGRFGGDEFMIIMENYGSRDAIGLMLGTIARHMSWLYKGINDDIHLTASIGVSIYPEDGNTYEELFAKADKALYIAKANGKDGYVFYDDALYGNVDIAKMSNAGRHMLNADWLDIFSDAVLDLHKDGVSSIPGVLRHICDATEISGITVYVGDGLRRVYTEGAYNGNGDTFYETVPKEYFSEFNDNQMFYVKNAEVLEEKYPDYYHMCENSDIKAFLQCMTYHDGKPYAVVSFDVFSHTYNWQVDEINALSVVAKLMGQVLLESDNR